MNFLAHTMLSNQDPEILAGNFMADFCQARDLLYLPEGVKKGIIMHREIDRFTDQHPQVKESIALFRPTQRKYSPVVVDILYDYFLTKFWHNYHPQNLPEFISETYATLSRFQSIFPEKLQLLFPRMIEDDFLMSCKNQERLTRTFERLGNRASFAHQFHRAIDDLQFFEEDVTTHFTIFFPELKLHIHRLYFTSN